MLQGLEGDEDDQAISMLSDTTAKLTSAVHSLPELLEQKRIIDMHTNIATALLDHIKVKMNAIGYTFVDVWRLSFMCCTFVNNSNWSKTLLLASE